MATRGSDERGQRKSTADEPVEAVSVSPAKKDLDDEIDSLLDEIDDVLEENAAEFVRGFVQKGGQ